MSHTPGPWRKLGLNVVAIIDGREEVVASEVSMFCSQSVREANCHLLTAAPDLLAACEELLCWMRDPDSTPEKKGAKCDFQTDAEAMARAAIAAARTPAR